MEERTTMNGAKRIWNYLRSGKTGKEAQRLERMALNDPFLYEALEGLESVDGEHEQVVEKLCRSLTHPPRKRIFFYWAAAVAAILGGVASGVLLRPAEPLPLASVTLLSDTLEREIPLMVYQDSAKSAYGNNAKELLDYSDAADFSGQEEEEAERPRPERLLARADQAIPKGAGGAEEVQDKRQQVETLKKAMPLAVHGSGHRGYRGSAKACCERFCTAGYSADGKEKTTKAPGGFFNRTTRKAQDRLDGRVPALCFGFVALSGNCKGQRGRRSCCFIRTSQ